jgi:2-phospho-L-lactate transferase/gluconeogenesis factor (CofD/UPF0052 family)
MPEPPYLRQATEGVLNASATAAASGTTESKENYAPATRNAIERVKKFDEVIAGLGTSVPSFFSVLHLNVRDFE